MKTKKEIVNSAVRTIKTETEGISKLLHSINDDFINAIQAILNSSGRVVITGIGKSANIGQKIVATLNSTGTPAIFMHAADAIHGDLGIVQEDDIVICISKSGETPEIKVLVPLIKMRNNIMVAMVGNIDSFLAKHADFVLDVTVDQEACPNNLAPTTSTTAQLVMGDALSVAIMDARGFTAQDFAKYHPGGSLGKKLYLKASDIYPNNERPAVDINADIKTVILEITSKRLGGTAVLDNDNLVGFITDGDLRRMLSNEKDVINLRAKDIMTASPKTIAEDTLIVDALATMRNNSITQMIVVEHNKYLGVIHLHDILKEGIL
ncbi:MAG: SIS domain-containing protein [Hyphomicrobiales bacterium]